MKAFVSVVVFLSSVFLQQGNSLNCEVCGQSGTTCQGSVQPVRKGVTQCIKGMENNTLGDSMILTTFRASRDPTKHNICGMKLFLTSPGYFLGFYYDCCHTDGCNKGPIPGTYVDPVPNGYECPGCLSLVNGVDCKPDQTIKCSGNQKECIRFTGTAIRPGDIERWYSVKGCVSKGGCTLGLESLPATKPVNFTLSCTAARRKHGARLRAGSG
nr:sodefrin precursor-like factor beta 1 [Eurycea tynerensis]